MLESQCFLYRGDLNIILVLIISHFIVEEKSVFHERMKKALTESLRVRIKGRAESGEIILGVSTGN